ncbi:disease resistance protein RPM1-like [Ipomoea triloba]|uniref:disease resistance protein RPM1-like n=1 Tax=Ipomoea triloba TaxID=35885 RepID=UPI00125DBDD0|nr:disease resistance protein RPM1-like [Ipomoea triloba]
MADGAINFLLEKLATILCKQAALLGDASDEIEEIRLELEFMRSFIRDAERRKERSELVETWVRQVREVSNQVENIIDEFVHFREMQRHGNGIRSFVKNAINLPRNIATQNHISSKLQKIKAKVHEVSERSKRYAFSQNLDKERSFNFRNDCWQYNGDFPILVDEDEIVGMDENKTQLSELLNEPEHRQTIISIVGMGGLGKTTLATKLYNDQEVQRDFECCAWISLSQACRIEELLRSIVRELLKADQVNIPNHLGSMAYIQLIEMLIEYLRSRRYLVVLDDVWAIDLWSRIRKAFPENNLGSRIILTTRNKNVATSVGPRGRLFHLEPLNEDDAWTVFCKKAFATELNHFCPSELEALARSMLTKCQGLPLAIVAIGGLMCTKDKTVAEWKKVNDSLNWQLSNNPMLERVKGILALSFNDLPFYLKYCFLYCCVFPEGYPIKRKKLIRLWVDEGFIIERQGMLIEEVAEDYLAELIFRSMNQVTDANEAGRVKALKVHDVMRELAITTTEKENFCMVYNGQDSRIERNTQRLSLSCRQDKFHVSRTVLCQLRSLFVFKRDICSSFSLNDISSHLKFLRVLDLQGICIEKVPNALTGLFNLRYLSLRETKIKCLPESTERLQNLQTLDVRNTHVERLPRGISNLEKLRHLFVGRNDEKKCGLRVPIGIGKLQMLQSLSSIIADDQIIQQLGYLTNLRSLDIKAVKAVNWPKLGTSIQMLKSLRRLSITASNEEESLELGDLISAPPFLQKLTLVGQLNGLPHWLGSLQNLTHLHLGSSLSEENILSCIDELPILVFLELQNTYNGKILHFRARGFPKLNSLKLLEFDQLEGICLAEGALPSLRELYLIHCKELKQLPQGIEHIASIRKLHLEEMPEELIQNLRINGSKDQAKVQHIQTINHVYKIDHTPILETLS